MQGGGRLGLRSLGAPGKAGIPDADPRGRKGRPGLPPLLPMERCDGARGSRDIVAGRPGEGSPKPPQPCTPPGSTEPPATVRKTSRPDNGEGASIAWIPPLTPGTEDDGSTK